jgi:transcriptional regulator with XRE-family HTH domain
VSPSQKPDRVRERRVRFGDAVRERRIAAGLSQEALAERCGVDRKSISRMETGAFSPSLDRVWVVAEALDVTMHELFEDAEPPEPRKPATDPKHRRRSG